MVDVIVLLTNILLVICYGLLFRWYWMEREQRNNSSNGGSNTIITSDRLERWILLTIALGVLELAFRICTKGDEENPVDFALVMSMMSGSLKNAVSRSLLVVLSVGVGASLPASPATLSANIALTSLYLILAISRDVLALILTSKFAKKQTMTLSRSELHLEKVVIGHEMAVLVLDAIFVVWICVSLHRTVKLFKAASTTTLSNEQQRATAAELERHQTLERCFWIACALQAISAMFVADIFTNHRHSQRHDSIDIHVAYFVARFNFLFILTVVAVLWRPGSNNRSVLSSEDTISSASAGTMLTTAYTSIQQIEDNYNITNNYNNNYNNAGQQNNNDLELSYTPPAAIVNDSNGMNNNDNSMMNKTSNINTNNNISTTAQV